MLIDEYFIKIEKDIISCPFIHSYSIIKDKRSINIGLIDGVIKFIDDSILCFMEFVDVGEKIEKYKYSYNYYGFAFLGRSVTANWEAEQRINCVRQPS